MGSSPAIRSIRLLASEGKSYLSFGSDGARVIGKPLKSVSLKGTSKLDANPYPCAQPWFYVLTKIQISSGF